MTATVQLGRLAANDSDAMVDGPFGSNLKASEYVDSGVPIIRLQNIRRGSFLDKEIRCVTPAKAVELGRHSYRPGDVVIAKLGECGAACIVPPSAGEGLIVADVVRFRGDPLRIDHRFLVHFLNSAVARRQIAQLTKGTTRARVNLSDFKRILVPIPTPAEQCRIAEILDRADAICRKRKEVIALTEELMRSAFLEMFGDPVTNPKGWPTETIDELCARGAGLVDGPFGSSLKPEHYVGAGVKVVRNWNIYDDQFDSSEFKYITAAKFEEVRRSEVLPWDVLITTKGTVGDICVAPDLGGPAVLSASGTVRLRVPPDESFLPEFVVAQMTIPTYKRYLHRFEAGSAQQYLNLSAIRKMCLIRPPIEAQGAFRKFRARVRQVYSDAAVAHTNSEYLFGSLVERVFSGGTAC